MPRLRLPVGVHAAPVAALLAVALAAPALPARAAGSELPVPAVTVAVAAEREIVERTVVTGTLVPRDEILVSPEIDGYRITELLVEEGDRVAQGDVLARLSREMLDAQLAQNAAAIAKAEGAVAQAQSTIIQAEAAQVEASLALERTRTLMKSGNATEAVLEQRTAAARSADGRLAAARNGLSIAEAELTQARALRRELDLKLARTEIRAPEGGIVSRRTARVGSTASGSGEPLFRLIARGEIELEGEVTETGMPRLKAGAPARLDLDTPEGPVAVQGRVRAVYPEIDRATRLGKVRIRLEPDPRLRIGAFARGSVEVARRTGVAVPIASVIYGTGGATALVVTGDRVEARSIRTGLSAGGLIEIRDGVKAGDAVVARAGSFLRDGDRVRPIFPAQPATADAAARP
ncbi:efflux RND transporter periplasmic adaptor subunit [Methylobacterium isbiliense]|uniref:Multidrug resistance protein MdtA n=1 Tax=Methylobacterium isbiliense TaxID=315478 RepID=A0ABQ4SB79_9HYPH|nr:efflux RND transporter periplasmic adaptor subunit [Methylobacterium isbiliense]MDN3626117.1 efflux RND transporter periplasmic adaptor subunit [Methylobacterium isbiliense]GJE00254.1 Multidrug resistance protein MdtA [Methylobacterium isbiliense]